METMMDIINRIAALSGCRHLATDAAFDLAYDAYSEARERARYAQDDLRAAVTADESAGLRHFSEATEKAKEKADAAKAAMRRAVDALEEQKKRYGGVFLSDLQTTADEISAITLALANAVTAVSGHAFTIANFASRHGLPVHRSIEHAAGLDSVARRLRYQP